ncbi:MAG: ATP-binding protein [Arthrobacter sp.]|jgi:signal transduction histidine kinase|nr:ATP-binding protein [Arthrobacter sp.]
MHLLTRVSSALGLGSPSGLTPDAPGGATATLLGAINRVVLVALCVWQAVMVATTVASPNAGTWVLAPAQALILLMALAARRKPGYVPWVWLAMVAAGAGSFLASGDIDSALTFAGCWQINFSSFVAGLLMLRRATIPLVVLSAAATSAMILVFLPGWGLELPISVCVTQTTIILAIRVGVSFLLSRAAATDRDISMADAAALHRESLAHRASRIAEESRVLHDTAINTFAAIASAGASVSDPAKVRRQCASDVEHVGELRDARSVDLTASIRDVFTQPGLPIRRLGADDAQLERVDRGLGAEATRAVVRCVREAVNNASKHSGAEHVDIDIAADANELVVRIADTGRGFDPELVAKRGLATSIERRARDHGIDVEVASAPGRGTTVTLRAALGQAESAPPVFVDDGALREAARTNRLRAGLYWGVGVTLESIVLTATGGTNEHLALLPMIALMIVAVASAAWPAFRRAVFASVLLIVATVLVFVLSARATGFGTVAPVHWQALAAAGPAVLFLSVREGRRWRLAGAGALAAAIMLVGGWTARESLTGAAIVLIAGVAGFGFSLVWVLFLDVMERLSEAALDARRHEFDARLAAEREAAAQASYERWTNAGLDAASELLRGIRDGALDPGADSTRAICDEEERYLRQLVLISPELIYLGTTFMPLLQMSREAEVRLTLRLGDQDTDDAATAMAMAQVVQENIAARGRGGRLSATLFPVSGGLQLTLTGEDLRVPERFSRESRLVRLGGMDLLEIDFFAEVHAA